MATFYRATFEVISGGKTCPMYEDPEQNDEENPFQQRRYIEAVTGAPFEVLLTLRPGFEFGTCDAVRVEFCFDNMSPVYFVDIKREDAAVETGVREQGQLTFAKLEIKEKSDLGIPPDTLADLGAIEVWYQRIWYGATRRCNLPRYDSRISEVSEKTLKGRSIEHSIEAVNFVKIKPPKSFREGHPVSGKLGQKITMKILYRSKKTLQMLGCMPRSPSPEPVDRSTAISTSPNDIAIREELVALRARLAELERNQPNVKPERARVESGVKRERDDKEDQAPRKRNRRIETIDLTDD